MLTRNFLTRCQNRGSVIVRGNELESTECSEPAGHNTGAHPTPCRAFGRPLHNVQSHTPEGTIR